MKRPLWIAAVGVVLFFSLFISSHPAFSHAYLTGVIPPIGTVFESTPETIRLIFTERIDDSFSTVALHSVSGDLVQALTYQLEGEDQEIVLKIDPTLADDGYQIHWKVLSREDGHVTEGIVPLAVGVPVSTESVLQQAAATPSAIRILVRWLAFVALLILAGSVMLPPLIIFPKSTRSQTLVWGSLAVLLTTGMADLQLQANLLETSLDQVILHSQWGQIQGVKYLVALVLGILVASGLKDRFRRIPVAVLGGLMLFGNALTSHNANLGWVGILTDWAHLLAGALWFGGLAQLVWMRWPRAQSDSDRMQWLVALVARFSLLALISVVLLLASGLYGALAHITSFDALFSTLYGKALLTKAILMLPILALASINRFWLVPQLTGKTKPKTGTPSPLSKLRHLVIAESIVVVVVLFFAGILTLASPHGANLLVSEQTNSSQSEQFITQVEEFTITLAATAHPDGNKAFELAVEDEAGNPVTKVQLVRLKFDYLDKDLGAVDFNTRAVADEDGHFRLQGVFMTLAGQWRITAFIRMQGRAQDLEVRFHAQVEGESIKVNDPQ